jgi:hypothetical protein
LKSLRVIAGRRHKGRRLGSRSRTTFTNGLISIKELLFAVHKAGCKRAADFESAGHGFHFLLTKFASTPAGEYAIVLVHKFLLDDLSDCTGCWLRVARRRHRLIGVFAIEYANRNQGACGQRSETAAYLLDFLFIQVTKRPGRTNTLFWLFMFFLLPTSESVERAQDLQESLFGSAGKIAAGNQVNCTRGDLRQLRRLRSRCIWSPS